MKKTKIFTALIAGAFAVLSLAACNNFQSQAQNGYSTDTVTSESSQSSIFSTEKEPLSSDISTTASSQTEAASFAAESTVNTESAAESVNEPAVTEPKPPVTETEVSITTPEPVTKPQPEPAPAPSESEKILVAYFSWSGTSERIANNIVSNTGADSYRIERETPYSSDYNTVAYGEAKDEADSNARPPLKNAIDSIDQYDTIVLCYPIWWHTAPMTVGTFLNKFDFSGKTVIPVSQSASMSTEQYEESLAFVKANAQNANVLDGIYSKDQAEINSYLAQNGVE